MQANNSFQVRLSNIQFDSNQWEKLGNLEGNQKIAIDPVKGEVVVSDLKGSFSTEGVTHSAVPLKTDAKFTSVWLKFLESRTRAEIEAFEIELENNRNPKEQKIGLEALNALRRQIRTTEKKFDNIITLYQGEKELQAFVKIQKEALYDLAETTMKNVLTKSGKLMQFQRAQANPMTETVASLSKEILETRQKAAATAKKTDLRLPTSPAVKPFRTKVEDAGPEATQGALSLLATPPRSNTDGLPHQFVEDFHRLREVKLNGNFIHILKEKNIALSKEQLALEGFKKLREITGNHTAALRLATLMTQGQIAGISTKVDLFFRDLGYPMTQFTGISESIDIKDDKVYITLKSIAYARDPENLDLASDAIMEKRVVSVKLSELSDLEAKSFPSLTVTDFISSPIATPEYAEDLLSQF